VNRDLYRADAAVLEFVDWMTPFLTGERQFFHRWTSPRWGSWACESLFDVYLRYDWPFSVVLPNQPSPTRGRTFADSVGVFNTLSAMLRAKSEIGDAESFLAAAKAVVGWGGVRQNLRRLDALGSGALPTLTAAAAQLNPRSADTLALQNVLHMNSGFSKIYSLLLDGFPIYDSRVACALASLVAWHCREASLKGVPDLLAFRIPPSRSGRRNPSDGAIRFGPLRYTQVGEYAVANLHAAWLLEMLAQIGRFGALHNSERVLALQSALFMVGYEQLP